MFERRNKQNKKVRNDHAPRDLNCSITYNFERERKNENDLNTQKKLN